MAFECYLVNDVLSVPIDLKQLIVFELLNGSVEQFIVKDICHRTRIHEIEHLS